MEISRNRENTGYLWAVAESRLYEFLTVFAQDTKYATVLYTLSLLNLSRTDGNSHDNFVRAAQDAKLSRNGFYLQRDYLAAALAEALEGRARLLLAPRYGLSTLSEAKELLQSAQTKLASLSPNPIFSANASFYLGLTHYQTAMRQRVGSPEAVASLNDSRANLFKAKDIFERDNLPEQQGEIELALSEVDAFEAQTSSSSTSARQLKGRALRHLTSAIECFQRGGVAKGLQKCRAMRAKLERPTLSSQ